MKKIYNLPNEKPEPNRDVLCFVFANIWLQGSLSYQPELVPDHWTIHTPTGIEILDFEEVTKWSRLPDEEDF